MMFLVVLKKKKLWSLYTVAG